MGQKFKASKARSGKKEDYPYPSFCGSHSSMVMQNETDQLGDSSFAVCKDYYGLYVTERKNIDNGLADPWRCANPEWRQKKLKEMNGQVIDVIVHPGQI
jgi:hypothetical protein